MITEHLGRWRLGLPLVGLALFAWILYRIDVSETARQLMRADARFIALSMGMSVPFLWLKSERWRLALRWTGSSISSLVAFRLFAIGQLAGLATPGQLGDMVKAFDIRRQGGTLQSGVIASIGDRSLDLAILLGLGVYYGALHWHVWPILESWMVFFIGMTLVALTGAWLWLAISKLLLSSPSTFQLLRTTVRGLMPDVLWSPILLLVAYTLVVYTLYGIRLYLLLLALDESAPVLPFISSMAVMSLSTLLPISVAGIGTRDVVLVLLFEGFNLGAETAVGFSFLVLGLSLFNGVIGLIALRFHFPKGRS